MADAEDDGYTITINYHIKKVFSDSELEENSVIRKFRITAADGKSYNTNHYSLEMIIAVGFKVNSERAVQFRSRKSRPYEGAYGTNHMGGCTGWKD